MTSQDEAGLRFANGAYLDLWHGRLKDGYTATMTDLGVTADLDLAAFLPTPLRLHQIPTDLCPRIAVGNSLLAGQGDPHPPGTILDDTARYPALTSLQVRKSRRGEEVLQIQIGPERAADSDDSLGRSTIGWRPGLTEDEAWNVGRGKDCLLDRSSRPSASPKPHERGHRGPGRGAASADQTRPRPARLRSEAVARHQPGVI